MAAKQPTNEVKIKCDGKFMVKWRELEVIQGNLKELTKENYEKFKKRVLMAGFKAPFFVWFQTNGRKKPVNTMKVLDGTQRTRMLAALEDEGVYVPNELPADPIFAATEAEARNDLLGFVSQFGHLTEEGFYEYLHESPGLDWEELKQTIDLPGLDVEMFEAGYINGFEPAGIEEQGRLDEKAKVTCPECGHEFTPS